MEEKIAFWQHHMKRWKQSSLTQSEYCKAQGISFSTFRYWRSQLKINKVSREGIQVVQVSASVLTAQKQTQPITLKWGPCEVSIPSAFDDDSLGRLLTQIKNVLA